MQYTQVNKQGHKMLAHNIKEVLTVVPEAMAFVKKASLEQDFPTDSKDSVSASYLTAAYLTKSAGKVLDINLLNKLEKAASLYGVKEELDKFIPRFTVMTKVASREENLALVKEAEAMFEGDLCGFLDIEAAASKASALLEKYAFDVTSEEVRRYAGSAYLNKSAAIHSLANRYYATKEQEPAFIKIAGLINTSIKEDDFRAISDVCKAVTSLDKRAGLDLIGFNFYKEALITKQAALDKVLTVKLNGQSIPYTKIASCGKETISSYLGSSVKLTGDSMADKATLEGLPADQQAMLLNVLKNVK